MPEPKKEGGLRAAFVSLSFADLWACNSGLVEMALTLRNQRVADLVRSTRLWVPLVLTQVSGQDELVFFVLMPGKRPQLSMVGPDLSASSSALSNMRQVSNADSMVCDESVLEMTRLVASWADEIQATLAFALAKQISLQSEFEGASLTQATRCLFTHGPVRLSQWMDSNTVVDINLYACPINDCAYLVIRAQGHSFRDVEWVEKVELGEARVLFAAFQMQEQTGQAGIRDCFEKMVLQSLSQVRAHRRNQSDSEHGAGTSSPVLAAQQGYGRDLLVSYLEARVTGS